MAPTNLPSYSPPKLKPPEQTPDGFLFTAQNNDSSNSEFILIAVMILLPVGILGFLTIVGLLLVVNGLRDFLNIDLLDSPGALFFIFGLVWVLISIGFLIMLRKGFQEMTTYIKNTKKFQGAGKLLLSQSPLKLGDHCQAQFCRSLASGNSLEQTAQLKARLLCAEIVTYRVGTDDTTVRQIVFEQPLETQSVPTGTQTIEYTATLKIPSNATPSFEAKHNRILWQVEVKVEFDPVILQQKNTNKDPWVEDGTLSTFAFSVDPEVV